MLITKEVEIGVGGKNSKYYEGLGYKIPRRINKYNKLTFEKGLKIKVKIEDVSKGSGVKVKVKCDCCWKEYELSYNNYIKQNHNGYTYCNNCSATVLTTGENNPSWNPNKTDEDRLIGRHTQYDKQFVKKVLKRDNYTCQCCGKHSGSLIVHHLDGYNWCKDKRYDETNGITLCKNCHKNFHMEYGRGNNTKEQFESWLGQTVELLKYNGELPTAKKVYCIEENKIYDSAYQLAKEWGIKGNARVYNVCNHKQSCNTIKSKRLLWLNEAIEKGFLKQEDVKLNV